MTGSTKCRRLLWCLLLLLLCTTPILVSSSDDSSSSSSSSGKTCNAADKQQDNGSCSDSPEESSSLNNHDEHEKKSDDPTDDGTSSSSLDCVDQHDQCEFWSSLDECNKNPGYMLRMCPRACKICDTLTVDGGRQSIDSLIVKAKRELAETQTFDITETPSGVTQKIPNGNNEGRTREIIERTTTYVKTVVLIEDEYAKVRNDCKNRHPDCAYWAAIGECDANPKYMVLQCAPSCQTCDKIDFDARCPWDKDHAHERSALQRPGDLNKVFERIVTDTYIFDTYRPTVHSRPPDGPWVVTLDTFLTEDECDRLVYLGGQAGYEISRDVGAKKFDGTYDGVTSAGRTSTNAWCTGNCYNDTLTEQVLTKIENVTGIPEQNSEYLQLLRYEVSQFYHTHNDYIPHQREREEGVRILTVFLYLNDVEEGGGTDFPRLGITVQPKKGKAVIWPSVLDKHPDMKDYRTDHQALPVIAGVKYGANAWLHQRDFKSPYDRGCV